MLEIYKSLNFAKKYEELNNLPIIGKSTNWIKNTAHFDGFLEECGEEALADVLNLIVGTNNEERSLENFAKAIFKTPEEWATIAGAIAIQGTGLSAVNYILANNMAKRGKTAPEIQEVISNIAESQSREIVNDLIKNDDIKIINDVRLTDVQYRQSQEIKDSIYKKLTNVGINNKEAQSIALTAGSMFERYGTKNKESQEIFDKYMKNLEIKYNIPAQVDLKEQVQYNQDTANNYSFFINVHNKLNLVEKTPEYWDGDTVQKAKELLNFGNKKAVTIKSPIEEIVINEGHLQHLINENNSYRKKYLNRALRTIQAPNIIVKDKEYHNYIKLFKSDNNAPKPHLQIVKVKNDGSFYVTNYKPTVRQMRKILQGQVIYDLSRNTDVGLNPPANNIIPQDNNNLNLNNEKYYQSAKIKSVDNQGTFDKSNPNIYYQGSNSYNSFKEIENEFKEYIEVAPEDYKINNLEDALKDLDITENTPRIVNTPTGAVSVRVSSIEHIINGGDSTLHNPDKSRYKAINRMFAVLERPEIITMNENGKKKYIKLFNDSSKTKSQIAVVYNDKNGDYVYTTIPVTKHRKYILKEVNSGNVIYKKGQTRENISAANNIIPQDNNNLNLNNEKYYQSAKIKSVDNQGTFDKSNPNIYYQNNNIVDWTDKFDSVPTFEEIEKHIKDIIESGQVFDTLSPEWKIDIKGGNRVVDKITNQGNFQKLQNSARKRHNKYVKGIEELINNSVYSHSDKNNKPNEKPNVLNYHYFNVNVKIGNKIYFVTLECEENKNVPQGKHAKRGSNPIGTDKTINQTNSDVNFKVVHLYNIKELKNPKVYYQSAYHGTPHRFDKFSLEHIGSGEGNQAHGWGLYFAEDKHISENYMRTLGKTVLKYKGKEIPENEMFFYNSLYENGKKEMLDIFQFRIDEVKYQLQKIEADRQYYGKNYKKDEYKHLQKNLKLFQKDYKNVEKIDITKLEKSQSGQLYQVDIPDTDVLLDEEKPLNEQPDKVKKAILEYYKSRPNDYIIPKDINSLSQQRGKEFYRDVAFQLERENSLAYRMANGLNTDIDENFNPEKEASLLLNSLGIKGITYDGRQDGRCYVVFDDKAVKVLETYYQEITPDEQQLIAGYTQKEVIDKLSRLYEILNQFYEEGAEVAADKTMARIHILDDAFDSIYSIIWSALSNSKDSEIKNFIKDKNQLYMLLGNINNKRKN